MPQSDRLSDVEIVAQLAEGLGHRTFADEIRRIGPTFVLDHEDSPYEENDFKSPADYFRETRKTPGLHKRK